MSGGSYGRIHISEITELIDQPHLLERMRDRLIELGAEDAAAETDEIRLMLRQVDVRFETMRKRLCDVWRTVDRQGSGDDTVADVRRAVHEYRGSPPCHHVWGEWGRIYAAKIGSCLRRICEKCGEEERRNPDDNEDV
jgi:hypothetical protein